MAADAHLHSMIVSTRPARMSPGAITDAKSRIAERAVSYSSWVASRPLISRQQTGVELQRLSSGAVNVELVVDIKASLEVSFGWQ
jgi:hypothetical protein